MKPGTVKKTLIKKGSFIIAGIALLVGIKVLLKIQKNQQMRDAMANSESPEVRMIYYFTEIGSMVEPCKRAGKQPLECVCANKAKYSALSAKLRDLLLNTKNVNMKSVAMAITNNQAQDMDAKLLARKLAETEEACK